MQASTDHERRCYCGKLYQTISSLGRHTRGCPAFSDDCKRFLRLLAYLEPGPVPGDLFRRALFPFRKWNENGNESRERPFQLPDIFSDEGRLVKAMMDAIDTHAVRVTIGSLAPHANHGDPWWAYRNFELPESSRIFIQNSVNYLDGQLDSARLIFHGFSFSDLDVRFVEKGNALLPFVVPLLHKFPVDKLLPGELPSAVEVCISMSQFGDYNFKEHVLAVAETLAGRIGPSPLDFSIALRKAALALARGQAASVWPSPGLNRKGNSQRAEAVLFRAQQCIELGHLSEAWKLVGQWTPFHAAQPSGLEIVMSSRLDFMKGKLHRFQGNFEAARQYLEPLSSQHPPTQVQFSARLHLIAVYTELGLWEKGQTVAGGIEIASGRQRRLYRLALAELLLSRVLCGFEEDLLPAKGLFAEIVSEYEGLGGVQFGKTMRRNFFRACFGLAVIGHLQRRGQALFGALGALSGWELAYRASRECLVVAEGFPDLICHLAMAQLQLSSAAVQSGPSLERAKQIWAELSNQGLEQRFCFTNLGTRWADMVSEWLEASGCPRIVSQWGGTAGDAREVPKV
ncbi:hypothetical protein QC761_0061700 [Podospora bellae-mahoneyi]|uniref:C2H2-type domain-containing protein n=1 Tax=Podospora bellae-mahoneyi TaxID=2093777 RepID=A0ABR0FFU9_9PEZI|nr:hypothetical protein QC761_0061700 [Podospora bellae-mahoneyi]